MELFYQLFLVGFSNFGVIELDPPLELTDVLEFVYDTPETRNCIREAMDLFLSKQEMLNEYFSWKISENGERLVTLPLVMKGYQPNVMKIGEFLQNLVEKVFFVFAYISGV